MSSDKNEKQHDNNNHVKKPGSSSLITSKMFTVFFLKQSYATVQEVKSSECIDSTST